MDSIYEIVREAGFQSGYPDKHPECAMIRGPLREGLFIEYFHEIQSFDTTNVSASSYLRITANQHLARGY